MDNKTARNILSLHLFRIRTGVESDYPFYEEQKVIEAIRFCIEKLDREIDYYCNLPKGDDHNEIR